MSIAHHWHYKGEKKQQNWSQCKKTRSSQKTIPQRSRLHQLFDSTQKRGWTTLKTVKLNTSKPGCVNTTECSWKKFESTEKNLLKKVKLSNQKFLSELYKHNWKYKIKLQIFFCFFKIFLWKTETGKHKNYLYYLYQTVKKYTTTKGCLIC